MNNPISWQHLVLQSIKQPKEAAEYVLSWRLSNEVLWPALALVAVVNAILSTLSNFVVPVPDALNGLMISPAIFAIIVAVVLIASTYMLTWMGGLLGGTGRFQDMLALLIWLQVLRALAQVILLFLLMTMPVVATFFVLFVSFATLWIFVNFVQIGLGLNSMGQAVAVVIGAAAGLVIGLSLILSLLGVSVGIPANV
ncbi:MAG: YIP1 family protein [Roseobacter sp.]